MPAEASVRWDLGSWVRNILRWGEDLVDFIPFHIHIIYIYIYYIYILVVHQKSAMDLVVFPCSNIESLNSKPIWEKNTSSRYFGMVVVQIHHVFFGPPLFGTAPSTCSRNFGGSWGGVRQKSCRRWQGSYVPPLAKACTLGCYEHGNGNWPLGRENHLQK